jgi:3-hydroxyisobutyrate dehydrogenase
MTTVAVLGTGTMGSGMARQLLEHGHDVRVWNRTREKAEPLGEAGATVADEPADAVRGAQLVLVSLFDADAVVETLGQAADGLSGDTVVVQASTVGLQIDRVAAEADRLGVRMLDAPVLGTKEPAEQGALTVIVSGDPGDVEAARPVLDAIGARTVVAGEAVGAASRLKLAGNAWLASITAATAQSLALAQGSGLDPQLFLDLIDGTPVDTPYAHLKGEMMIAGKVDPSFGVDGLRKDLVLIHAAADRAQVSTDLLDALGGLFDRAADHGHAQDDIATVRTAF